jgi:long-chain acyl-CoA synthetase
LVSVVIPEPETFLPFANALVGASVSIGDNEGISKLCKDPKVIAAVIKELEKAGKAGALRGFEFVKRVHLTTDAFSVDNGMMTPTFKVRRPQVAAHFSEQIKLMYDDIHASTPVAKL